MNSDERNTGRIRDDTNELNPLDNSFIYDDRERWDLLSYFNDYMGYVNFFNKQNEQDGTWSEILLEDPIFYKASIITTNIEFETLSGSEANSAENKKEAYEKSLESIQIMYELATGWIETLKRLGEEHLVDTMEGLHDGVVGKVTELVSSTSNSLEEAVLDGLFTLNQVNQLVLSYQKILSYLQEKTKESLMDDFLKNSSHQPNNALYIAFVALFENIQNRVNNFPKRHLDFYYKEVLQQVSSIGEATQAIVYFNLVQGSKGALINDRIKLSAGKPYGQSTDLLFGIKRPLMAYPVVMENLYTIYLKKSPYLNSGTNAPLISDVLFEKVIADGETLIDLHSTRTGLFGADVEKINTIGVEGEQIGQMGFIISSPSLYLVEGTREIAFHYVMEKESADAILWELLGQIAANNKCDIATAFDNAFKSAFILSYTSTEDWVAIESYSVSMDKEADSFSINMKLGVADLPLDKLISEEYLWPAVKFVLNPIAPTYVYSFLKGLEFRRIKINVHVTEIRNLSVSNDEGAIDLSDSFNLFGSRPKVGSTVVIGKCELFKKEITDLKLHIDWKNLPVEEDGFEDYYKRYPNEVSNDGYKIGFSVLNVGRWFPKAHEPAKSVNLFEMKPTLSPEGYEIKVLSTNSELTFANFEDQSFVKNYALTDPLEYEIVSLEGFIRLKLVAPAEAFGKDIYPELVKAVTEYNAKKKKSVPLPNSDFIPVVERMTMEYSAEDIVNLDGSEVEADNPKSNISEFYQITPRAIRPIVKDQKIVSNTLVVDLDNDGEFFIELKNVTSGSMISVYFELDDSLSHNEVINDRKLDMSYRQGDLWIRSSKKHVVRDDTNLLTRSGIMQMIIPNIGKETTLLLKIGTKSEPLKYPYLKGIYFNAIGAYCLSEDGDIAGMPIEKNQITKVIGSYPNVKAVVQPCKSYGGLQHENERDFYRRTSHRLRHKDRALSSWDFEQLILDQFSDVEIVKCTNRNDDFISEAGNVLLYVVSKNWKAYDYSIFGGDRLYAMQMFLQSRSSPFSKIEVNNPKFEYLLVNCSIELIDETRSGLAIAELNQAIIDYLSPCSQIKDKHGGIGGNIVPASILSNMERLAYVSKVRGLSVEHIVRLDNQSFSLGVFEDNAMIKTSFPSAVFVPVEVHNISIQENEISFGLGHFQIGTDMIINKERTIADAGSDAERAVDHTKAHWWQQEQQMIRQEVQNSKSRKVSLTLKLNSNTTKNEQ